MDIIKLIQKQEKYYEQVKDIQNLDSNSVWYGEFYDNTNIVEVALPLYINNNSKYYMNGELLKRMELNIDFFLRMQFPNGLLSLWNCNIVSPPDTAFIIYSLSICLKVIEKVNMEELNVLKEKITEFLRKTIPGMITGGFHTPNHRWVISCALSFLYKRFGDEQLKKRICDFVDEGIDIGECGEWTERSNAVYNGIVDICGYHIAENMEIEAFYKAVSKNLTMMTYMLHPDDCIVTEYSTRQDRGKKASLTDWDAGAYLLMAIREQNGQFMYMAEKCFKNAEACSKALIYSVIYEEQLNRLPSPIEISDDYVLLMNGNNISAPKQKKSVFGDAVLRYRKGKISITLMAGQQDFMYLQYGNARIASIKLPIGWFGMGGVSFTDIKQTDENTYTLSASICGDYLQTLDKDSASKYEGNYILLPNAQREKIGQVETYAEITVRISECGADLCISVSRLPYIFTQLVLGFDSEGYVNGENIKVMPNGAMRPEYGSAAYVSGNDVIEVSGSATGHNYDEIRGDVFDTSKKNVIFNALSPDKWAIKIRCYGLNNKVGD